MHACGAPGATCGGSLASGHARPGSPAGPAAAMVVVDDAAVAAVVGHATSSPATPLHAVPRLFSTDAQHYYNYVQATCACARIERLFAGAV